MGRGTGKTRSQLNGLVERSVHTLKEILAKNGNLSQLMLQEHIYTINCKEDGKTGSATSCLMGRGTRTGLPNSWDHLTDWQKDIRRRQELKEKRVMHKERNVGKEIYTIGETVRVQGIKSKKRDKDRTVGKEIYTIGENVHVQDIKSKKWDTTGEIIRVRTSDDGTILSYDLDIDGNMTSRH